MAQCAHCTVSRACGGERAHSRLQNMLHGVYRRLVSLFCSVVLLAHTGVVVLGANDLREWCVGCSLAISSACQVWGALIP